MLRWVALSLCTFILIIFRESIILFVTSGVSWYAVCHANVPVYYAWMGLW